jgi:subtilase family serine protease
LPIQNLVNAGNPPAIISMSYGECEVLSGPTANAAFNSAFQTAAAAGVSVFASSGDYGASELRPGLPERDLAILCAPWHWRHWLG